MGNPLDMFDQDMEGEAWSRTVQEALSILLQTLSQEEKERIAGMPEEALADLHFGLGEGIRNEFWLWHGNADLLADCGRLGQQKNAPDKSEAGNDLNPDDAAMVLIRALWARLRH